MYIHFQRELDRLKKKMLSLGAMVEESVRMSISAMESRDPELAGRVIEADRNIDEIEVEFEEDCLKALALHQPVAIDLRIITAMIKINNDLERVGDEAVNIAERVITMSKQAPVDIDFDYSLMAQKAQDMLKSSLDSMVNLDEDLAYKVRLQDDEVDEMRRQVYDHVKKAIRANPDRVGYFINLLLVSRHLERIADHATNIAEEVIYVIGGVIPRHREADL